MLFQFSIKNWQWKIDSIHNAISSSGSYFTMTGKSNLTYPLRQDIMLCVFFIEYVIIR